jgi:hypothetical protein
MISEIKSCLLFGVEVKAVRGNEIDLATKFNNREVRLREFLRLLPVDLPTGSFVTVIFASLWFACEHNHFCL